MTRITNFYIVETREQPVLTIDQKLPLANLSAFLGEGFVKLDNYVREMQMIPSDTPYMRINGGTPELLSIQIGIAVPERISGSGEIFSDILPAGKKIYCYCIGDNSDMDVTYREMQEVVKNRGFTASGGLMEYYLNGGEHGEDKLLTKIAMAIHDTQ